MSQFVKRLARDEVRRLGDQMLRAARSATADIAEGYGRFHYQENIQFCRQARGSVYELLDHFVCAAHEKLATEDDLHQVRDLIGKALAILNGYINYLKSAKSRDKSIQESEGDYVADDRTSGS